jgi:hypothetical protein
VVGGVLLEHDAIERDGARTWARLERVIGVAAVYNAAAHIHDQAEEAAACSVGGSSMESIRGRTELAKGGGEGIETVEEAREDSAEHSGTGYKTEGEFGGDPLCKISLRLFWRSDKRPRTRIN